MITIRKESAEVFYPEEDVVIVTAADLDELKQLALQNPRRRVRLCAHRSPQDKLHEMFIVHTSGCYVRPHKHISKSESMTILEGEVDVILFNEDGSIRQTVQMGTPGSGKIFYQRLSDPIYHTLIIRTPFLVFHESTEGPFLREKTIFPEWAPAVEGASAEEFINQIESTIKRKGKCT
jgi:cupin fold WbuC family metalloprotein